MYQHALLYLQWLCLLTIYGLHIQVTVYSHILLLSNCSSHVSMPAEKPYRTADKLEAKYVIGLDTDSKHLHACACNEAHARSINNMYAHADPYIPSKDETSESNRHIRMTNSTGHAFECIMPPASIDEAQATDQVARCIISTVSFCGMKLLC